MKVTNTDIVISILVAFTIPFVDSYKTRLRLSRLKNYADHEYVSHVWTAVLPPTACPMPTTRLILNSLIKIVGLSVITKGLKTKY